MKRKKQKALLRFLALFVFGFTFVMFVYYNVFRWPYDSLPFDVKSTIDAMGVEENDSVALPEIEKLGGDPSKTGNRSKSAFKQQDVGACKIPKLEMNGSEVIKFYKKFAPLVCDRRKAEPWVFIDEQRRIRPTEFAKKIGLNKIKCLWSFYDRISDAKLEWTRREQFNFGDLVEKGDFFKVDCYTNVTKWSNPFMVVVPTADKVDRLKSVRAHATAGQTPLNVYILSFDSLSQMSFRRNLPKTTAFLENEMKSVVFNGYNIVGDGTPQAFIPILTGQTEEELPMTRKRYRNAHFVDEAYPFAWRNFSAAGYATMYGEDGHSFGTFTYRLKGFKEQPTGHYPITFFHYTETVESGHLCIGNEKQHNVWFRYIESFWREYSKLGIPRFSVMHHSYLSHDDLNRVQQVDDDLVAHLRRMGKMNAFENTLAIVMADHGARFSELRQTHQGQLEERLPFFSVHFPTSLDGISTELSKKALFNLKTNANNRLASPFDVHATLMDAIRWPLPLEYLNRPHSLDVNKAFSSSTEKKVPPPGRSLSFFREIPSDRTCDQAGIEPHWCTCLGWETVPNSSPEISVLVKSVVKVINDYTEPERKLCAPLKQHKVISAKKLVPNADLLKYKGVKDNDGFVPDLNGNVNTTFATYQIGFETRPGNARYEVTLFFDGHRRVTVDLTAISHVNKYGDAPHCIIDKNYFLATYCVCYDKIDGFSEKN
ncbi:hypothetical protein GPALN_007933 [Globodera pallida]|nr:hypothetical protein GPALN_007933 [Globodera pallida]